MPISILTNYLIFSNLLSAHRDREYVCREIERVCVERKRDKERVCVERERVRVQRGRERVCVER